MSEDVPRLTADEDIVALAREEIEKSREALRRSADEESEEITKDVQQPGVTIDLGHRGIQNLPEEVIDIIKDEIERLVTVEAGGRAECRSCRLQHAASSNSDH